MTGAGVPRCVISTRITVYHNDTVRLPGTSTIHHVGNGCCPLMHCGVVHKGAACAMAEGGIRGEAGAGGAATANRNLDKSLEKSLQRMLDPVALLEDDDVSLERLVHTFVAQDKISRGDDGKRPLGCPPHQGSSTREPLIKTNPEQKKVYQLRAPKQINLHFQSSYGQTSYSPPPRKPLPILQMAQAAAQESQSPARVSVKDRKHIFEQKCREVEESHRRKKEGTLREQRRSKEMLKGSVADRILLFEKMPEQIDEPRSPKSPPKEILVPQDASHVSPPVPGKDHCETLRRAIQSKCITRQIPVFYHPEGKPCDTREVDLVMKKIVHAYQIVGDAYCSASKFSLVVKACDLPLYWKTALFIAAGGTAVDRGLHQQTFLNYWKSIMLTGRDEVSWLVKILSNGQRNYLVPDDFKPIVLDVIANHPGLHFLREAPEFHSRYVTTVIARIYYDISATWSNKLYGDELRRSNLLQTIRMLEVEDDINKITDYFSYEHFYVVYCKFWELDEDHDLWIDRNDMAKHNNAALSTRIIERIFTPGVVISTPESKGRMAYEDFVHFLLAEENKKHPRAIEYWFRCMDLDGDGRLSLYELEFFYEEQTQRMECLGLQAMPFIDALCQMIDMIKPKHDKFLTLGDLKRAKAVGVFFDTFFNLEKYLEHEQTDPFSSGPMDGKAAWNQYAKEQYEMLISEE
ncbi:serine/threonine-protein phosphatase 2A regulatory subunit B'' subunit delta [Galendromus occidentalis]|uniref:Serine/threonine-protein phosphatase 2A regulatory subunit B'' subunit delta n=1 Tax=Galendromus occidentalis TaxID=34638 RepID=A0AAJ7SI02_9ACAR|nr:serine/threonine-protein phosphatase 2A regulatory subunit B'' subunit delta [Galendromus occidentalis]